MNQASRRPSSLAGGLILSGVTVAVCLLIGEIVARTIDPSASLWRYPNYIHEMTKRVVWEHQIAYDPDLGWEPIPGASGTLAGQPFSVSREGMREHDLNRPPATGPLILALGDSFTEGFAVGNDDTWPAYLERLTGRRVLNGGVRGYGIDQMVLRAERLVPQLKPQTVVLAFIADDVNRTALSVRDSKGKPYFVPDGAGLALHNVPVPTTPNSPWLAAARNVLGYSYLLDIVMTRLGATELWYGDTVSTGVDAGVVSCRLMDRFAAVARRYNIKALVVALPQYPGWSDPVGAAAEHDLVSGVLGCASKAGLPTLDGLQPFQKEGVGHDPDAYYVQYHFTARGNELAARSIAAILATNNE
jgi:GDSL-like lipase/acylhydrolase family protein